MSKLSPKKHGMVRLYVRTDVKANPWVQRLGGHQTTKTVLKRVRKSMAKRLKRRIAEIEYAPYDDGWIFLCDSQRIIWEFRRGKGASGWGPGEEWTVAPHELHREHPGYDE